MKIIYLADSISTQYAGIKQYGLQLIKTLSKSFSEAKHILIASSFIEELNVEQIIVPINSKIPFHLRFRQLVSIPKLIEKNKPDVVIELAHFGPFNLSSHIKKITVIHDLTPVLFPSYHNTFSQIMHRVLLPNIIKKADLIITNSDYTKQEINKHYAKNPKKIVPLYPKVNCYKTTKLNEVTKPYFLSVGTIEPRKNYITLIKAFELFLPNHPDFKLVIAGKKGWKTKAFFDYLDSSPAKESIVITDFISNETLHNLYTHARGFIFPSYYEGFGIPLLEAMFFNLPIIHSNTSSLKEVADGAGLSFIPDDHLELSHHMKRLTEDKQLADRLKEHSKKRFSDINIQTSKQTIQLTQEIVKLISKD